MSRDPALFLVGLDARDEVVHLLDFIRRARSHEDHLHAVARLFTVFRVRAKQPFESSAHYRRDVIDPVRNHGLEAFWRIAPVALERANDVGAYLQTALGNEIRRLSGNDARARRKLHHELSFQPDALDDLQYGPKSFDPAADELAEAITEARRLRGRVLQGAERDPHIADVRVYEDRAIPSRVTSQTCDRGERCGACGAVHYLHGSSQARGFGGLPASGDPTAETVIRRLEFDERWCWVRRAVASGAAPQAVARALALIEQGWTPTRAFEFVGLSRSQWQAFRRRFQTVAKKTVA